MPQTKTDKLETDGIRLKCPRPMCGHEWTYRGKRRYPQVTSCPACLGAVRVPIDVDGNVHVPRGRGKKLE